MRMRIDGVDGSLVQCAVAAHGAAMARGGGEGLAVLILESSGCLYVWEWRGWLDEDAYDRWDRNGWAWCYVRTSRAGDVVLRGVRGTGAANCLACGTRAH